MQYGVVEQKMARSDETEVTPASTEYCIYPRGPQGGKVSSNNYETQQFPRLPS